MTAALLAALRAIGIKLVVSFASQKFLEWLLFWVVDLIVKSTKTPHDDEAAEKIKQAYYESK